MKLNNRITEKHALGFYCFRDLSDKEKLLYNTAINTSLVLIDLFDPICYILHSYINISQSLLTAISFL